MALSFLDFEQPIAELEAKIDELRFVASDDEVNVGEEIARLRAKSRALTTSIFANLTPWQVAQLARHPQRPYTLDYAATICDEFREHLARCNPCKIVVDNVRQTITLYRAGEPCDLPEAFRKKLFRTLRERWKARFPGQLP